MTNRTCSIGAHSSVVYDLCMLKKKWESKLFTMYRAEGCYSFHSTANLDNMIYRNNTNFMFF